MNYERGLLNKKKIWIKSENKIIILVTIIIYYLLLFMFSFKYDLIDKEMVYSIL